MYGAERSLPPDRKRRHMFYWDIGGLDFFVLRDFDFSESLSELCNIPQLIKGGKLVEEIWYHAGDKCEILHEGNTSPAQYFTITPPSCRLRRRRQIRKLECPTRARPSSSR